MKLVTLNIWGGHLKQQLLAFFEQYRGVDIFCLQEVYCKASAMITDEERYVSLDIYSEIQALLPEHEGFFCPVVNNIYGLALFVRRPHVVERTGSVDVYVNSNYSGRGPDHHRQIQWAEVRCQESRYTVINFHGLWNGMGKGDCFDRLKQSLRIKFFMWGVSTPVLLCGDFNLKPDTKSMRILSMNMQNLVQAYGVTSTRTDYYKKPERFADYVLASQKIKIQDFKVLAEVVSDHAALFVDFE